WPADVAGGADCDCGDRRVDYLRGVGTSATWLMIKRSCMTTELPNHSRGLAQRMRTERVRAFAEKHWLGKGLANEQAAAITEIRHQSLVTAQEYFHAASTLYDTLGIQPEKLTARKAPFALGNRNVQLFLSYSILWEAFNHIYTAAAYTAFATSGPE